MAFSHQEFLQSDLVRWFGLHQTGRIVLDGREMLQFKPGGPHQAAVDVDVWLGAGAAVERATLTLSRQWVGSRLVNPFAIDLAKSFISVFGARNPSLQAEATAIDALLPTHSNRTVIVAARSPLAADPNATAALTGTQQVFLGTAGNTMMVMPGEWRMELRNTPSGYLMISISFRAEDCMNPQGQPLPSAPQDQLLLCFLQQTDIPYPAEFAQDSRTRGADPDDTAFVRFGGLASGLARWQGQVGAPFDRLIDIRWLFPSESAASAYHQATLTTNAEGCPFVSGAPSAGSECAVADGGGQAAGMFAAITGRQESFASFFYLFRVGPVVVKLYANQQPGNQFTVADLHQIAARIPPRISAAFPTSAGSAKPSTWWRRLLGR